MKKKNAKAMGKARKLLAPGPSVEAPTPTRSNGYCSLDDHLDLYENLVKNAIDDFFS